MPLVKTKFSQKYTLLLTILIFRFLTSPLLGQGIGRFISSFIMLWLLISIVAIFIWRKRLFWLYTTIAALAFCIETIGNFNLISTYNYPLVLFSLIIYSLYLGLAAWLIMKEIFLASEVSLDTLFGGIAVYFLIGFIWTCFYAIVEILATNSFSQSFEPEGAYSRMVYFSFTTLTTLGYGDIVPVNKFALVLANTEAIIGQMYPAIFIATLVGSYLSQRSAH